MTEYIARKDDNQTYLAKDSQMDDFLKNGCNIYMVKNGIETLIATPEDGYLVEKPKFPIYITN